MAKKYILKSNVSKQSKFDLGDLNDQQSEAVLHQDGPLLVIAGAGSGKTKTLVYRVARLIHDGINPKQILLLTFTRKASQEMLRRAADVLDARCQQVSGGTFHSFCNTILHQYASAIQYSEGFTIMDRSDAESLIGMIRKEGQFQVGDKRFPKKGTLLDIYSKSVNTGKTIEQIISIHFPHFLPYESDIEKIIQLYHIKKEMLSLMDYDDLLVKMVHLLTHHEDVRKQLSQQYRYILVDEFQDTNHIQLELLQRLCDQHENIMVVGDDAQSIYSFRGADITNMLTFDTYFPSLKTVNLNTNYRSTQTILDLSNDVINQSTELFSKELLATNDVGEKPIYVEAFDDYEQSEFITQRVLELREEGVDMKNIAILFRSGSHSNQLELTLQRSNVPFKKFGGFKFTETAHIKDVLSYIKVMVNPDDQLSWHRILQQLEGVGPKLSQTIIDYMMTNKVAIEQMTFEPFRKKSAYDDLIAFRQLIWNRKDSLSPTETLQQVIDTYKPILKQNYDDFHKREQDLESLMLISERYKSLKVMLDEFTLEPPETSQIDSEGTGQDDEYLVLSTIHSAKGLEWSVVFILSAVDGYLPSFRSLDDPAQIEEERRLMYVAITRAKDHLYIMKPNLSAPGNYYQMSGMSFSMCSRFLTQEMIQNYCEVWALGYGDDSPSTSQGPHYSL